MPLHTFDHRRPDLAPYGFTCERWEAAPMRRPDRHNEIELNLLLRGAVTYLIGGARVTLREGRLGAFWAAVPHQIIGARQNPEYFVITLPLAWFLQCRLPARLEDRLLAGSFITDPDSGRLDLDLLLCRQWERDLEGRSENPSTAVQLELHARLRRLAEVLPEVPTRQSRGRAILGEAGVSKAEQMGAYIARHYRETVLIHDVAREVGLHPNYAMTLFKKSFRTTLNDYLTQYRIAQAQRLLATTDEKVIHVALESGFQTSSRFYDAFRRACGCSPNRYRELHRSHG